MKIRLRNEQVTNLVRALRRAGRREIGGQLFGRQLATSDFEVMELTIQRRAGSFASFMVDLVQAARDAIKFFKKTGHAYRRFNYIGEWHSHPSFAVHPSDKDTDTMRALVSDSGFRGNFAVLLIVRLTGEILEAGAWVFDPYGRELPVTLEYDHGG